MKAWVNTKYGSVDVLNLKEIEQPVPGDNQVLIKIHATTVNRSDTGIRKAEYFIARFFTGMFKPKFHVLGSEFSGTIEQVGKDVTLYAVGDAVFGLSEKNFGAHAEFLCLNESDAFDHKPENLSFEQATAILEGPYLALNYLDKITITPGFKILVNGASGSIGSSGVQLATYYGAEVTAVTNTKNMDLAKELGAKHVIDYTKEDFTQLNETFDCVFDAVGKSSFFKTKKIRTPEAKYFSTELGFFYQNVFLPLFTKKVLFPIPKTNKEQILFLKKIAEEGKLRAVIDRVYPFDKIKEAHIYVETGQKTGSVVITAV